MQQSCRTATIADLKQVCKFTDYWLSGRGLAEGAPGAVNDYFISPKQHKKYIEKYVTYLVLLDNKIIAWCVIETSNTMIHLLVSGYYRGRGVGSILLKVINPLRVRSKSNQSTGNPTPWYESHGYKKIRCEQSRGRFDTDKINPGRPKIIDVLERKS